MGLQFLSRKRKKECNIFLWHTGEPTSLQSLCGVSETLVPAVLSQTGVYKCG